MPSLPRPILHRRQFLGGAAALPLLAATGAARAQGGGDIPIIFVHGNGDNAAIWLTTIWRFESNGYDRSRLFAIGFTDPLARDDDNVAQPGRSSTDDQLRELSAFVDMVKSKTGAPKVALAGLSRGGYAIRNFVSQPERAADVSHVVLCGTPNHGVFAWDANPGSEFNGRGPFLKRLNGSGDSEIVPGPSFLTLRSDGFDKYAQADGRFVGKPGASTGVTSEGPALKGAVNLVLGDVDHRETACSPRAFREIYKAIASREPARIAIAYEDAVTLNGRVTGNPKGAPTNRPLAGAVVSVYVVSPETGARQGDAIHRRETDLGGAWGPVSVKPTDCLEFVVAAPGLLTTHIYRSPFPRSSDVLDLRPSRPLMKAEEGAGAVLVMSRPRGYFGLPRDIVLLDGVEPRDIKPGVPVDAVTTLAMAQFEDRPVLGEFNLERIAARPWPTADNHMTIVELTY